MPINEGARPAGSWGASGDGRASNTAVISGHQHFTPEALAVYKRGRWCVVGKLTILDGEVVLGIAHRHQHGVTTTISVPVDILNYAQKMGARWLYFRRDATAEMYRLHLDEIAQVGWLGAGAGAERYIPISRMQKVSWRAWQYAEKVVRLGAGSNSQNSDVEVL